MKYNSRSISLQVDSVRDFAPVASQSQSVYNAKKTEQRALALSLLIEGSYNKYGRHIDLEKYNELCSQFEDLVREMEELNNQKEQ